jgi:hypothetical protein
MLSIQLLTPKELATMLGLSEQRLAVLRLEGNGPAYVKIGKNVRYAPEAVQTFLAQNRRKSTSVKVAA